MKSFASLIRSSSSQQTYRKKFGNVNMVRRKDLRRIKKLNIYHRQINGQQNQNNWFTPKRLKAMGNNIQNIRNNHIGSNPVDLQTKKQLLKIFPKMSDYQYWIARNAQQQLVERQEKINSCESQFYLSQLPAKLRNEIASAEEISTPQICEPLLKYIEQMQIFLPLDERHRYNLMQKIIHPPKSKLEGDQN